MKMKIKGMEDLLVILKIENLGIKKYENDK
jgi:hypothetical protein